MTVFQVGKYEGAKLKPAFKIERRDDGGIRILDQQDAVTDQDRTIVFAHFGRQLRVTTGVRKEQHRRLLQPGSQDHFAYAVRELPAPFALMRKS